MKQKRPKHKISTTVTTDVVSQPLFEWPYKLNEKTGEYEYGPLQLSNGFELNETNLLAATKATTGSSNVRIGDKIFNSIARGMSADQSLARFNDVSTLLPALKPQDETEALLLGQFLTLQDSGMKCLRHANLPDQGFYHIERFFALANKLLNTANQTMQTLLKYRSGGQQTVQVIHMHNEGQAIVAQNLAPNQAGDFQKKS